MHNHWRVLAVAALLLGALPGIVAAQELTTDAERTWREIRNSSDVRTKLLAERWYGVVRLQEWSNASGKFTTQAKYVEHDPNLEWVKLRVIEGIGENRVVKDVTVPLEKLSKTCQSRVRQIANLTEKVADAVAAEAEAEEESADGGPGGDMRGRDMMDRGEMVEREQRDPRGRDERSSNRDPRGGRGAYDPGLAGMDPRQAMAEQDASPPPAATATAGTLPAQLPPLPGSAAAASGASSVAAETAPSTDTPNMPDSEPWRTDYEAFRTNFAVYDRGGGAIVQWGSLQGLHRAHDQFRSVQSGGAASPEAAAGIQSSLEALGEFSWEATVAQAPDEDGDWTLALGLSPLPEPLKLRLLLDPESGSGPPPRVTAGSRVRFFGRFIRFEDEYCMVAAIRFPAEQPAADGAADAQGGRR